MNLRTLLQVVRGHMCNIVVRITLLLKSSLSFLRVVSRQASSPASLGVGAVEGDTPATWGVVAEQIVTVELFGKKQTAVEIIRR